MINAAITPGTHPIKVNMKVITMDPHPLSSTASGGHMSDNNTLNKFMICFSFINEPSAFKVSASRHLPENYRQKKLLLVLQVYFTFNCSDGLSL